MMKRLVLTALLLTALMTLKVFAQQAEEETAYESIDGLTEEELSKRELSQEDKALLNEAEEAGGESDFVRAAKGFKSIDDPELEISYENGFFIYKMPYDGRFYMNVPLGGITDEAVVLKADGDAWITDFIKDGKESLKEEVIASSVSEAMAAASDEDEKYGEADKTGHYDFRIMSASVDRSGMILSSSLGGFLITKKDTPLFISRINPPLGYEIEGASSDGRPLKINGSFLELKEDGLYEVDFKPVSTGLPHWRSVFLRDTTAPELYFTPSLTGQVMNEEVAFHTDEADAVIRVYLNNIEVSPVNMTAAADGQWRMVISDRAGNENVYTFRMQLERKGQIKPLLLLFLILTASGVFIIITAHGRMRII